MSLSIQSITLDNFRSYDSFQLQDIGQLTILVGPNATGKTNLIESLRLITSQKTLRHATSEHLLRKECDSASVSAEVSDGNRLLSFLLTIEEGKRTYSLNGKTKKAGDLKGIIPSVAFVPDDLNLAKGSMSLRRQALDNIGEQVSSNHYVIRKDYEKVLRHKNHLLKECCDGTILDAINEMIIMVGSQLICYRMALLQRLMGYVVTYYEQISGGLEKLSGVYVPSWNTMNSQEYRGEFNISKEEVKHCMREAMRTCKNEELLRRKAVIGPHADMIEFYIDDMKLSDYGSQGQQRSFVLAFKLAEVALIRDMLQQQPVLLLDDVMSELDSGRREQLLSFISEDIQTFITTAHIDYFNREILDIARIVSLEKRNNSTQLVYS